MLMHVNACIPLIIVNYELIVKNDWVDMTDNTTIDYLQSRLIKYQINERLRI